jgi:hypothetical protein
MRHSTTPNIAIPANVWCTTAQPGGNDASCDLQAIIPGDLLVEMLRTRDVRILQRELTRTQRLEYEQSRFFQYHGQEGLAFEQLD